MLEQFPKKNLKWLSKAIARDFLIKMPSGLWKKIAYENQTEILGIMKKSLEIFLKKNVTEAISNWFLTKLLNKILKEF